MSMLLSVLIHKCVLVVFVVVFVTQGNVRRSGPKAMHGGPGPRATFGGGGRPYVANGPHSFCGAYRIVGGGSTRIYQALKKPTPPALCMTVQVSAELGAARHRR